MMIRPGLIGMPTLIADLAHHLAAVVPAFTGAAVTPAARKQPGAIAR